MLNHAVPSEISPNKRAGCQSTECKQAGIKIQTGELRFGTFVTIMARKSSVTEEEQFTDSGLGTPKLEMEALVGLLPYNMASQLMFGRGCVTPQQISNLKDAIEDDLERYLDGYAELDKHDKERIAKAVEEGHVADEDWKGVSIVAVGLTVLTKCHKDVEVNRPGQKGFRTPASKKKAKDGAKAQVGDVCYPTCWV